LPKFQGKILGLKLKGVLLALIASTIIPLGSPSISQAANPSCTPSSTRVTTDGYLVESFTATNNSTTTTCDWSVPLGVSAVDVLVVGGGGGGGYNSGGGGGGGGASAKNSVSAGDGGSGIVIVRFSAASGDFTAGKNISATFRVASNLTVTVAQPAKVTFLANGKAIPGCKSIRTTGSSFTHTVTCAYKPSVHGVVPISALVNPVGSTGTPLTLNGGSATSVARAT
jgi:hypothetical protein